MAEVFLPPPHPAPTSLIWQVFLPDDVQWDESTSVLYPLACMVAGLCAGLFGIGGGIIKGPLMLEMGMLPQVASPSP
jgi:hypothetical protein